jgi:hypothetical protein
MPGPWIADADLLAAISQGIKKPLTGEGGLRDYWTPIATRCVNRGYMDVRNALVAKGFTLAQLDAWDDRVQYNLDQSLYWAYIEGGGPADQSERDIKELNRAKQINATDQQFAIMINGAMVTPGGTGEAGGVGTGRLTLTTGAVDAYNTFGLRRRRTGQANQYGDAPDDDLYQW